MISSKIESFRRKKSWRPCRRGNAKSSDFIAEMQILSYAWAGGQLHRTSRPVKSCHDGIHAMGMLWHCHGREYRNRPYPSAGWQDREKIIQVILHPGGVDPMLVYQKKNEGIVLREW